MANVVTTARTPYSIASSALVMIGANPVASFAPTGTAETIACYYTWQPVVDHFLSLYPWRFASLQQGLVRVTTVETINSKNVNVPVNVPDWDGIYAAPTGMKFVQHVVDFATNTPLEYERYNQTIWVKQSTGDHPPVIRYTYEPPIADWPGYFASLIEAAMMHRLSFALSAKLDLKKEVEKNIKDLFLLARSADSQQQTTKRINQRGRHSIMQARRA